MREQTASILCLLAAILWGTTGTAQSFAPESAHPIAIGAMRLAVGGGALLLFVGLQGKLQKEKNWPILITAIAAAGMAAYQPLFFSAVAQAGVAVGTVVAIGSAPILAGILEFVIRRKKPERRWWMATLFAIAGCLLLFSNQHAVSVTPAGVLMAIGAGLSFAIYTIVSKQLIESHASDVVTAVVFSMAAIFLLPLLFFYPLNWLTEVKGIGVAVHLGLFATALAYLLFAKGLSHIPAANAVTLALAEPLTAAILGVFIVRERVTSSGWIGIALLFCGLLLLSVRAKKVTVSKRGGSHAKTKC